MTTLTTSKVITPITHRDNGHVETEYKAEYDGQLIGFYATHHQAEVALDDQALILCEQGLIDAPLAALAKQSLRAACELGGDDSDPFADPRTDEEKANADLWVDCEGGWEQHTPHPFDSSKTIRLFLPRLFTADDTDEIGPDGPTPNDDVPNPMDYDKRCPHCNDIGPCFVCGAIDLPAIGRALCHEMRDDRPALLRRLRATPERWHRLLAHAYVLEIGRTPHCDGQPAESGVLWLWNELLRAEG